MTTSELTTADIRVRSVSVMDDELTVGLMDGRKIAVPLAWYPRLARATPAQRSRWEICGGGYGIHWPDVDEDLNTEGLLLGSNALRSLATSFLPAKARRQRNTTKRLSRFRPRIEIRRSFHRI